MQRHFYTVYKTTNLVNSRYYFGVHKTRSPYDDYLGSGTYIRRAVAKYGEQNFRKEVLFIYLDPESAFGKEDELIQCCRGRDPLCMNLNKGGHGGWDYVREVGLHRSNTKLTDEQVVVIRQKASKGATVRQLREEFGVSKRTIRDIAHGRGRKSITGGTPAVSKLRQVFGHSAWNKGKKMPKSTRLKLSNAHKKWATEFPNKWVHRGSVTKTVVLSRLSEFLAEGWKLGRK